jgi:hypothetical protein
MKKMRIIILTMIAITFGACSGQPLPTPSPAVSAAPSPALSATVLPAETPSATVSPSVSPLASALPSPQAAATAGTGLFQLKGGSMSVAVPKGWSATDMSSELMSLGILYTENKAASIILLSMALPEGAATEDMDEIYRTSIENSLPGGKITKQSDVTVSGIKGKQLELTAKSGNQEMRGIMAVFVNKTRLYTLTGVAAKSDFKNHQKTFTDAIKSLELK